MNGMILKTKSNEVEGRVVTVAVNAFGNVDSQNDISVSGSFSKTLKENFKRVKHFLNHDYDKLIGCPLEGKEENGHLVMRSELAETQLANDVLSFYKLYQKNNLTLEHSVGVEAMQRDPNDTRKVLQWKLWEFSTLYSWGSNSDTPLLGIKKMPFDGMSEKSMEFVRTALSLDFSDHILLKFDDLRKLLEKADEGKAALITCECGNTFNYFEQEEVSIDREIISEYNDTLRYMFMDEAWRQAHQQRNEVRQEVIDLLADMKGKSLMSDISYVTCPYCGRRHYRNEIMKFEEKHINPVVKPSDDTAHNENGGFSLAAIGNMLVK